MPTKEILVTLLPGFVLFVGLCLLGVGLKWAIQVALEKKFEKAFWPELISDTVAVAVMILFSIYTAPYMGLGPNPLLK